jgi:anti-sigma regulatory factor (Ser/Thr protein kinase)
LTLSCNIQADVPERLVGDPERLQQVIFNLVDNAIKFTARGEVVIQVTAEEQPEQHPSDSTNAPQGHNGGAVVLHVSVRDTGRGLPSEQLQAFTQWFATGNATSLAPTSGLGLPLAQRLVLAMGGSLEMSSEANGGTTCSFSVRLQNDLAQEDDAPPRPTVLRDLRRLVEEEAFDRDALWALVDGDAALLQELIGSFELDCGRFLFALQHAVATENSHDLLAAVGALQDTVNQFAAHAAARVLTEIERTGDQGHFAQVREALPFLLSELSRLKTALDALAQDISASAPAKNF